MTSRRTYRPWWLVAGAIVVALAHPVSTAAWTPNTFSGDAETTLLRLTNNARVVAGLQPLPLDASLTREARARSRDMIERDYFSHRIPPDERRHSDDLAAMGACFTVTGENIGWNEEPTGRATQAIQAAFMASPPHHDLLLHPAWEWIGIGAFQGSSDRKMWTVLFGVRCPTSPTSVTPLGLPAIDIVPASGSRTDLPGMQPLPALGDRELDEMGAGP